MPQPRQHPIVQHGNEVRLFVNGEWYAYSLTATPLGAGAMGTVYLGWSTTHRGMKVAIKRVAEAYENVPSIRQRALLEASLLFRHRNLVEMVGCCEWTPGHGPIFIVSHLVEGINLDRHVKQNLRQRPDAVRRICQCIIPVLDALDYLHDKGIYHLDIKPSNIMIENGSNIRLMDLGIASAGDMRSVQVAGLLGTPQYAAPEQCSADGHRLINATTDIYEAGVTLYELLTEYNPYDAPTIGETMKLHDTVQLPYADGVPNAIVDVLRKATAHEQNQRYQTAREFKAALLKAMAAPSKPKTPDWLPWVIGSIVAIVAVIIVMLLR